MTYLHRWQIIQLYWFSSILINFLKCCHNFNFILFSLDKDRLHTKSLPNKFNFKSTLAKHKEYYFGFWSLLFREYWVCFILLFTTNYKSLGLYNTIYQQLFSKLVLKKKDLTKEGNQLTLVFEIVLWPRLIKIISYNNIYMTTLMF